MTTYGTISTGSSPGTSRVEFISRAKERIEACLGTKRPWREMLHREALDRVRINFDYVWTNYAIIVLLIVFLSLLWRPLYYIVLMVMMIACLFLCVSIPSSSGEALDRVRTNFAYFRMNYAIIVLFIVFLSLIWYPISLIVLMIMMIAWLFLYFLRDFPLVVLGITIHDRVVQIVLSVVTAAALLLTHATLNIIVSLLLGFAVGLVHAVFRKTDDLCLDEEAMGNDGDGLTRPLPVPSS